MAGNVATPKLLGNTPDPYDGNPTKAQAFWNTLANYYTMNEAVYNTNDKKVPAALTNFKAGTCGGDWASDRIAEALAANPTNYGTWAQFQTAFEKQFIPPQVQQEAIKGMHDTYMGNREFNDWYQDWTHHARRSGVDDNTKMYAFRRCINAALQQKLVALSPQPATLPDLVDKARDLDRSFRMFAPRSSYTPSTGGGRGRGRFTPRIRTIEEEDPTAEINVTRGRGQFRGRSRGTSFRRGKLSPEERERRFREKLCMYCGKPGHVATNCNLGKCPGTSLRQMDSIPDQDMDKMSIHDNVEANQLSTNQFAPIADMNVMDAPIKMLSVFNTDPLDIDVAHINHTSF